MELVREKIFVYFAGLYETEKRSLIAYLLLPVSFCYAALVGIKNALYDRGRITPAKVDAFVVSIGNIAVGGVGKTGFIMRLLQDIAPPAAVISRGYRSLKSVPRRVSSVEDGDEAFLIASAFPDSSVFAGKKMKDAAELAAPSGFRLLLLDDGMQHRKLHRDIDICLLHRERLLDRFFLPTGFLRDFPGRLAGMHYIVVTGIRTRAEFDAAARILSRYTAAPIIGGNYRLMHPEKYARKRVAAFCGIGLPAPFFRMLREAGADLVHTHVLNDHASFSPKMFRAFQEAAQKKGAEMVVCTGKDTVKQSNTVSATATFEIGFGKNHYRALIAYLS